MFIHNLKFAFRNLRKYKAQNIISIIGLAIGFTCFAFSALWIRYEMSYDSFHPKADRIYRVNAARLKWETVQSTSSEHIGDTPFPLADWLKSNYPEVENACRIRPNFNTFKDFQLLYIDQSFCEIFDIHLPEDFFIIGRTDRQIAIIPEFNNEESLKLINENFNYNVHTIMPRWPANTNISFNLAVSIADRFTPLFNDWRLSWANHTYILIKDGIDVQALENKLDKVILPEHEIPISLVLTPLKKLRYNDPTGNIQSDIKFSHIQIFAIAGLLVILCSLFNHLTLFVTRVRMRLRELALRKVNGATNWQIAAALYIDFLLVIVLSLVVGFMLMAWLLPTFKEYASIRNNNANIYAELALYTTLLIACGFVVGSIPVLYFRKQVLNESIKGSSSLGSRNLFRRISLLVQLIISIGMIFCAAVFIKQLRFLHQTDLGINRRNVAAISLSPLHIDQMKQIPGIMDVLPVRNTGFLRNMTGDWQQRQFEKDGQLELFTYDNIYADPHFFDFFEIEIIEGMGYPIEFVNHLDSKVVINETAVKEIGKEAMSKVMNIVGVARDFYLTPSTKTKPVAVFYPNTQKYHFLSFTAIAYRYEEGMRKQTEKAVTKWMREELFPNYGEFEIDFTYMEDIFDEYFKSDRALLTLLSVMTLACILIAVFGVYSLTSLTCQQRRKEIAIRKVHGAEVIDIMNIFFKEYLILLAISALVAFPAGFLIMKRWLENYVKQTTMDAWLYIAIFLVVFIVIVISIFYMVWKAANRNPAEVVKSE